MEINIIELYRIFASEPKKFEDVLRNLYGREIYRLLITTEDAAEFIEQESGEDALRNKFIKSTLEDLLYGFDPVITEMSFFRYVKVGEKNSNQFTSDYLMIILASARDLLNDQIADLDFGNHIGKEQDIEVFKSEIKKISETLSRVREILIDIDECLEGEQN